MSPVLLTFQNYLSHTYRHNEALTIDLVQNFLNHCLQYPHWQQNAQELSQGLKQFLHQLDHDFSHEPAWQNIRWPTEVQVIELKSTADQVEVIQNFLKRTQTKTDKCRVLHDPYLKKTIGMCLSENGSFVVRVFHNQFQIINGNIEPLRSDCNLIYNQNLELQPQTQQYLEIAPYCTARFVIDDGLAFGGATRGYVFQKYLALKGEAPAQYPKLFYALKRIEQHFIRKESDPFYMGMIQDLEKSILTCKMNTHRNLSYATESLAKAQSALENVFMGDKLMSLLIRDLQILLEGKSHQQSRMPENNELWTKKQFDLTN